MHECVQTAQITSSGIWKHLPSSLGAVVPSPVLLPQRRAAAETPRCPRAAPCWGGRAGPDTRGAMSTSAVTSGPQPPPPLRCGAERAQRRRAPPSSAGGVGGQGRRGGRGSTRDLPVRSCITVYTGLFARPEEQASRLVCAGSVLPPPWGFSGWKGSLARISRQFPAWVLNCVWQDP